MMSTSEFSSSTNEPNIEWKIKNLFLFYVISNGVDKWDIEKSRDTKKVEKYFLEAIPH